ncbi:MAG TPA: ThuA domain-containing protein [Phycisphaerae bacterium]|jgi:trehalose utilization protein
MNITIWNEFRHEKKSPAVQAVYPDGIHVTLAAALKGLLPAARIRTATLDEAEHGLTEEVLGTTDVLLWWGHRAHGEVSDAIAERVQTRVLEGMGAVFLHSAHYSKPFKKLMGTGCGLKWREAGERERLFVVNPAHRIASGLPPHFDITHEEMYGEYFDVPTPDDLIMLSWFAGGNVFRSLCTWVRGKGRVVYFRPGHETYPTYHQAEVQRVIANCADWAAQESSHPFKLGAPNEPVPV